VTEQPAATHPSPYRGRVTAGFFAHLFKAIFKQHHRELLPMLRPVVPEDAIVFDVGAHAGQFAKLFARLAPKGFVFAFEPGSYARAILRAAIRLNRIRNVAILPLGLGSHSGVAVLSVPVKSSGSYGFGLSHMGRVDGTRPVETEIVGLATIDAVVEALALDRLDFIKADIEGFELRLVEGARTTLARLKPALFLEMNSAHLARAGDTLETAWQTLTELGYRPHQGNASAVPLPIDQPREGDILWLAREG
jgi:FkbM family methyltransferase